MDYTALAASIDFTAILTFIGAAVGAAFGVRVALKGVTFVKSALSKS
ncbi:hypothetical protein [Thalassolituus oleivorans]|nr:hypothetical protein [Thalassolituus oleivorans]